MKLIKLKWEIIEIETTKSSKKPVQMTSKTKIQYLENW